MMVNLSNALATFTIMLFATTVLLLLLLSASTYVHGLLDFGKRCNKFAPVGKPDTCNPEMKLICLFGTCMCTLGSKYDKDSATCTPPNKNLVDTQKFGDRNLR